MAEQKASCGCGCIPQQQICVCGGAPHKQKEAETTVPNKTEKETPKKSE